MDAMCIYQILQDNAVGMLANSLMKILFSKGVPVSFLPLHYSRRKLPNSFFATSYTVVASDIGRSGNLDPWIIPKN